MIVLLVVVPMLTFGAGALFGRTVEWSRVLRYVHRHEDDNRPAWWIAAGIAADCHWRGDAS